jgi:hypothetical protein
MKLKLGSPPLDDVRGLLERGYESLLPSEATIAQAWLDPLVSGLLEGEAPAIGRLFVENAIQAMRLTFGVNGIQTGVPTQLLSTFAETISNAAAAQGSDRWVEIAAGTTNAVVDIAIEVTGEIPIVGWATKFALGIARLAQALAKNKRPRMPLLAYTKETDEFYAREALRIMGGTTSSYEPPDWTPLFLPPGGDYFDIDNASNGFVLRREGESGQRPGLGCLPPGIFGSRVVQVRNPASGWARWHDKKSMTGWYEENVFDAFVQLPGLARIGQAAWSAATSNQNAAIYNLRYQEIANSWDYYSTSALAEAQQSLDYHPFGGSPPPDLPHKSSLSSQKWNSWPSFQGAALKWGVQHANYASGELLKTGKTDSGPKTAGQVAQVWCDLYNQRAWDMVMTHVCAYASQRQAWFQNAPGYRARLDEARRELLQHPAVKRINPDDCPDRNYENALRQAGAGTSTPLKQGEVIALGKQSVASPVRMPNTIVGVGNGGGGGLLLGAGAIAAAVGVAFALRRGR